LRLKEQETLLILHEHDGDDDDDDDDDNDVIRKELEISGIQDVRLQTQIKLDQPS